MLSGIKFIPGDQLEAHDSAEERKNLTEKEKRDGKKMKDKRSKKQDYISDSDSGSDFLDSESEDERSNKKKKRKGRRKEGTLENSSGSEDYIKKRRGKKKDRKEYLDNDDWAISQSEKELARKEMGLEWMLGPGSSLTTNAVKNDSKQEEL